MTSISPANQQEFQLLERRFWNILRQTFSHVLDTDTGPVEDYWASLSNSSPYERLLALHDDPLDVAAVLTGITLTPDMVSRYEALLYELYAEQVVGNPPYWGSEVPGRARARPQHFVPKSVLVQIMQRLGYSPGRQEGEFIVWQQSQGQRRGRFRELPQLVPILAPMAYASLGEEGYDKQVVLDVFNRIIDSATRDNASSETLRIVREQRDEFARRFE
jgi:hypothetical protein